MSETRINAVLYMTTKVSVSNSGRYTVYDSLATPSIVFSITVVARF